MKTKNKIILSLIGIFIISISLIINNSYQKYSYSAPTIIKDDNNETIIAAYIDGELSTSFPTTKKFNASVECYDRNGELSNANASVSWDNTNTKWMVNLTGITNGSIKCNIYFEDNSRPKGWKTATSTSLLGAIKNNVKDNTTLNSGDTDTKGVTLTYPGRVAATQEEGLRAAEDDYGTSFYYRGAVTNNYVKFADMCWRIVRIDGNGNIKLVLFNYKKTANRTGSNVLNPCHSDYNADDAAYARYDNTENGQAGKSVYNTIQNQNAYVGLIYGTPGSSTYAREHNGNNVSTILENLNTWYNDTNIFLNEDKAKIATVAYCNDKTLASSTYNPDNWEDPEINKGYGQIKTNYAVRERLEPENAAEPVLTCPDGSKLENKIGLLTADEVAFAGGTTNSNNSMYYLYGNTKSIYWFTSSPSNYSGLVKMHVVYTSGMIGNYGASGARGLRPAIALSPNVTVSYLEGATGDKGTSTNPFVIE